MRLRCASGAAEQTKQIASAPGPRFAAATCTPMPEGKPAFLQAATHSRLLRAVALNHRRWMLRGARAAGGEVRRVHGMTYIYTSRPAGEVTIPFPRPVAGKAGEALDAILEDCRCAWPVEQVACWSLHESPRPRDLGVLLAARGFEWGWRPHWMWLDLHTMPAEHPVPDTLRIELGGRPRGVWHFVARLDGRVAGHSTLNLTTGRLGVAGIFDVEVIPALRGRGIGTALTRAACLHSQQLGCRYAVLNATPMGEPVYRRLGFESMGYGQTWWLHREGLAAARPAAQVRFVEALGRGDLPALDALAAGLPAEILDRLLPCGLTPMQLAVKSRRPESASWLAAHGATLDVVSAWDLGWKDRAAQLLAEAPRLASARIGRSQVTPMHEADARGDVELARLVLAAGPDLELEDAEFHSTPLGWAQHLGQTPIAALIEQSRSGGGRL